LRLTCLWQVRGRANLPFPKQVELDIEYLTHRNLLMDLLIVLAPFRPYFSRAELTD